MSQHFDENFGLFGDRSNEPDEIESQDRKNEGGASPSAAEHLTDHGADSEMTAKIDGNERSRSRRSRVQRSFPAVPFEEALELPLAIQKFAAGTRIRRLRLFELLQRSPDSGPSRQLISNSSRYNLTTGSYSAEWIELTTDGRTATAEDVPEREKIRARFKLAIELIPPFKLLYDRFVNTRLPVKTVMADFLIEQGLNADEVSECVDTFLLNVRFVGILQTISGAERLLSLDYVLDYAPAGVQPTSVSSEGIASGSATVKTASFDINDLDNLSTQEANGSDPYSQICFYITPIGDEGSEQRQHADLFLGSIIEPALEEFGLKVVRADQISAAGMITRQMIEHIIRSRLVIADLSYHNPKVFYELGLRHATGLPTVQIMRGFDRLPFDVNQVRTIVIDTSSIYALIPKLDVHRAAIASQVRRALQDPEAVDNPVTPFYGSFKVRRS
jgi:hypothetical protein